MVGVLLIKKTFVNVQVSLSISTTELRAMLDTAMEILHDLDGGSKTIMRCRDTLARLLFVVYCDGTVFTLLYRNRDLLNFIQEMQLGSHLPSSRYPHPASGHGRG